MKPFCRFIFNSRILPQRYTLSGQSGSLFAAGLLEVFEELHRAQLIAGSLRRSRESSPNELRQEEVHVLLQNNKCIDRRH